METHEKPEQTEMLKSPVCIIGAARSGTTLLISLLSRHPDMAALREPKYLWRYRQPSTIHDERGADDVTSHIRNYIRSRLNQHTEQQDGARLVEKTPSNSLRVPFIYEILPEVRFIHLIRDGRDVSFSARKQWQLVYGSNDGSGGGGRARRLIDDAWSRVRAGTIPVRDLPLYAIKFARTMWRNVSTTETSDSSVNVWGPKFPGIQEVAKTNDLLETCAIQWRESVRAANDGLASVPDEQQLHVRFEDLVQCPRRTMHEILNFAGLSPHEDLVDHAGDKVNPDAAHRWRDRPTDEVERVMQEVGSFVQNIEPSSLRQ